MNFYWNITNLNTKEVDGIEDVVVSIDYICYLTQNDTTVSQKGMVELEELESIDQTSFTSFGSLTEEQVKEWIVARRQGTDMMEVLHHPQLEARLNLELLEKAEMPVPKQAPWENINE